MTMPLLPLESESVAASSDLDPAIPFEFGEKEAVSTAVDTLRLHFPSSSGVISLSSWACSTHPCPCPPVPVLTKLLKRIEQGYRDPAVTTSAVVGETRSGMLMTTACGVVDKEGRKTTELNQNQTTD